MRKKPQTSLSVDKVVDAYKTGKCVRNISHMQGISDNKVIKILVTAGIYQNPTYNKIKILRDRGKTDKEIRELLQLKRNTLNQYTAYKKCVYGSDRPSENALKIRKCREKQAMEENKMNTNIFGKNAYYAKVKSTGNLDTDIHWGFDVSLEHGELFTVELAKELLDKANVEYKKGCPKEYYKEAYDPSKDFVEIRCDMSNYTARGETMVRVGNKKEGTYNKITNVLRIYVDDLPVYENDNGVICRDTEAMVDGSGIIKNK